MSNKLIINPLDKVEELILVGLFSSGSYEVYQHYTFRTIKKTPSLYHLLCSFSSTVGLDLSF